MKLTASDLGMPFYKKNFVNGNLFITFDVKFPKSLTELQMLSLTTSLSTGQNKANNLKGSKKSEEEEVSETVILSKMQDHHKNVHAGGGKHGRDADEEEEEEEGGPGGQGV